MQLELRHLRYFLAVAEELNFSRAAERLHIAQPALSAQIRSLETQLGTELFSRTTRKVDLTPAGELLLADARDIVERADRTCARQSPGGGARGRSRDLGPRGAPLRLTVLIAMAGMFVTGNKELTSVGVGAMLVVATAVAGSLTVLPALLSLLGDRIERLTVRASADHRIAAISIGLVGSGTDARSEHALVLLRARLVPGTLGAVPGVEAHVGGLTAESKDFNDLLKRRAPLVFAFVLGLAFLLLLAAFRSLVVAAKEIVLNLLSVGAAYGLLVAVFQWGWGESLLGFESTGGITSWLPLFLFVVLFGLSMDYHVFILTRVREAVDRGLPTERAVSQAVSSTAGTVTSAALVMVGVFAVFATLSQIELKQLGVGLAAAILIDATIVRAVVLPAAMKLLGRWNWYLPSWLDWLPRRSELPCAPAGAEA
jgi:uncharacterized membrane protein YdfJ with MMPL/SSD domain